MQRLIKKTPVRHDYSVCAYVFEVSGSDYFLDPDKMPNPEPYIDFENDETCTATYYVCIDNCMGIWWDNCIPGYKMSEVVCVPINDWNNRNR